MPVVELMLSEEQVKWLEEHGYEKKGEWRYPARGDAWINDWNGRFQISDGTAVSHHVCFRKAAPPPPVWRAWRDRSEVPVKDVRFIRFGVNEEETFWSVIEFRIGGIYACESNWTYGELFRENAEYSEDGLHWNRCGVLEKS